MIKYLVAAMTVFALPVPLLAEGVSGCDSALIKDTFQADSSISTNYRMASLVEKSTYDELTREGSANAVIYGVPVGADYGEYREAALRELQARQESYSHEEIRSTSWSGLGVIALAAYTACLEQIGRGRNTLVLSGSPSTEQEQSVAVQWFKDQFGPDRVTLAWTGPPGYDLGQLPEYSTASGAPVLGRIKRPTTGKILLQVNAKSGNKDAGSGEIVIAAFSPLTPPPQQSFGPIPGVESVNFSAIPLRTRTVTFSGYASMEHNEKGTPQVGFTCFVDRITVPRQTIGGVAKHENNSKKTRGSFVYAVPADATNIHCRNENTNGSASAVEISGVYAGTR